MIRVAFERDGFRMRVWQRPDGRWGGDYERLAARGWIGVGAVVGSEREVREFMLSEDRWAEAQTVASMLDLWFRTRSTVDEVPL